MFLTALLLCIIPLAWAVVIKVVIGREIHLAESVGVFLAGGLVVGLFLALSWSSQTGDTQVLNGWVTGKEQERTSCSHSYDCRCRTREGRRYCDTCYEHPYDYDWVVRTSVGSLNVPRVDRRGTKEPPRWTQVVVGEPAAMEASYTNYVKAAPHSLFSSGRRVERQLPAYPYVYDLYRFQHARVHQVGVPNLAEWNTELADTLKTLGAGKEVNVNLLFVKHGDQQYGLDLEEAWLGGKKNDLNIVVGVGEWPKAKWAYAFTYARSTGNERVVLEARNLFLKEGALADPKATVASLTGLVNRHYRRTPMDKFRYLAAEVRPSVALIVGIVVALILVCGLLTFLFSRNDIRHY